jgi:hypothetical protein
MCCCVATMLCFHVLLPCYVVVLSLSLCSVVSLVMCVLSYIYIVCVCVFIYIYIYILPGPRVNFLLSLKCPHLLQ